MYYSIPILYIHHFAYTLIAINLSVDLSSINVVVSIHGILLQISVRNCLIAILTHLIMCKINVTICDYAQSEE